MQDNPYRDKIKWLVRDLISESGMPRPLVAGKARISLDELTMVIREGRATLPVLNDIARACGYRIVLVAEPLEQEDNNAIDEAVIAAKAARVGT